MKNQYVCNWTINNGQSCGSFAASNLRNAKKALKDIAVGNCPQSSTKTNRIVYTIDKGGVEVYRVEKYM